jgi:hypothetical protein
VSGIVLWKPTVSTLVYWWKILYKKCVEKRGIRRLGRERFQTPHAKMPNAAREVCNFPVLSCPSPQAEFGRKARLIYQDSQQD